MHGMLVTLIPTLCRLGLGKRRTKSIRLSGNYLNVVYKKVFFILNSRGPWVWSQEAEMESKSL